MNLDRKVPFLAVLRAAGSLPTMAEFRLLKHTDINISLLMLQNTTHPQREHRSDPGL